MKVLRGLIYLALILTAQNAFAATRAAMSCSSADVLAMLKLLVPGDIGIIPPCPTGGTSWTSPIIWTAPANVTVKGYGETQTVFVDNYAGTDPMLSIITDAAGTFQFTGFGIKGGNSGGQIKYGGIVSISGLSKKFRMDHFHIDAQNYSPQVVNAGIRFTGHINGVVDHFTIDNHSTGNGIQVWFNGYGGVGNDLGNASWAAPTGFGGSDFLFIEDGVFNSNSIYGAATDCTDGGKINFRHNVVNGEMVQTHATQSGTGRGCRAYEIGDNVFKGDVNRPNFTAIWTDAGTALIHGNSTIGYTHFQHLLSRRSADDGTGGHDQGSQPTGLGYCGKNFNGTGSTFDGNTDPLTGYPCADQPGRGQGDLMSGWPPNFVNTATGCDYSKPCLHPRNQLEPIRQWNNNWTPVPNNGGSLMDGGGSGVFQLNRDYYFTAPVAFIEYPYPHPLTLGGPLPPDPTPIPPTPPTNQKPVILSFQLKNGSTVMNPAAPIMIKSVTMAMGASDDVGVTWIGLYVEGLLAKSALPTANPTTMTATWNTNPYKGKTVKLKAVAKDADGVEVSSELTVTVQK